MVAPTTASKAPKPPSNPPAAEERDKPRLTDAEKKRNHIASGEWQFAYDTLPLQMVL
jgi:hypothetical protein